MILDASYHIENDKPVIDLYTVGDGKVRCERVRGFEPYFYVELDDANFKSVMEELACIPEIKKVEDAQRRGIKKRLLKIVTGIPADVPRIRDGVRMIPGVMDIYEADILFTHRYFIDSGKVPLDGDANELKIAAIDFEMHNEDAAMPTPDKHPITIASYADTTGLETVITYKKTNFKPAEIVRNEKELISFIHEIILAQKPDIIVGYNSDNFDFPYILKRAEKYGIRLMWGFEGATVRLDEFAGRTRCTIKGRPHIDVYPLCRMAFNLPRYQLEDVYTHITGEKKIDLEHDDMIRAWKEGGELFDTFCEYALADATATREIARNMLPMYYELTRILRIPIQDVSRMTSAQRIEQLLILESTKNTYIIPNKASKEERERRKSSDYEGAFVQDPIKGLHENIYCEDFSSLYPSIIITHNVDPYTVDCECCKGGKNTAPTTHHFCEKKTGFISGIEASLIERRKVVRGREKAAKKQGETQEALMLGAEQLALKVLANSLYGYLAYPGARWYKQECGAAITAWGREYIHATIEAAEKAGFIVLYGDTDSIYIKNQDGKRADERVFNWLKEYNESLPDSMDLKHEGFFTCGFFITKKRYALLTVDGEMYIKGLETKRRDWAKVAKDAQKRVLDFVLRERDPKGAASFILETLRRVQGGAVPLTDLGIHTQLTRGLGEYVGNPMPHVEAVKKGMKHGYVFHSGDIVQYVIVKDGMSISDKAKLIELCEEGEYDPEYYIENQVLPAVSRVMYALGYDREELLGMGRQMRLGEWF